MSLHRQRGSVAGNIITVLLLVGIVGLGLWLWLGKKKDTVTSDTRSSVAKFAVLPGPSAMIPPVQLPGVLQLPLMVLVHVPSAA